MASFSLPEPQSDPLLALIGKYRADNREDKIDLGVGVYRDNNGETPVLAAVKAAEDMLLKDQGSKSYLGLTGDIDFVDAYGDVVFGATSRIVSGAQTPGGSGALRLAAEVFKTAFPDNTLWIGLPTWPNHLPLTESAGIKTATYEYFDVQTQQILFDQMMQTLSQATAGDAVLLHGCCHNPTGADLSPVQWQQVSQVLAQRSLLPIIDLAYHGLGRGMAQDLEATRLITEQNPHTLVATSCSKNFGMYRDRVGAVYIASESDELARRCQALFGYVARRMYSMPPDHGAAVVRIILANDTLRKQWTNELDVMANRVISLRNTVAGEGSRLNLQFVAQQSGMFSLLPLSPAQVDSMIDDHAVYMAGNGRINIAGCQVSQIPKLIDALEQVGFSL
ncbi:MAG: amino acid aminotransferase [Pseudomonadota bacterium]